MHPLDNQGKLVVRGHKPLWEYAVNFIVFGTTLMVPAYLTGKIIKTASISGGEATPAQAEKIKKMTPEELDKKADEILDKMRKAIGKDGTSSPAPEGKKMTQEELDKKADEILDKMRKRTSNPSFNNSATPDAKGGVERGGVTNPNVPVTPDLQPN